LFSLLPLYLLIYYVIFKGDITLTNKIWLIGGNIHSKNNEEKNNIGDSNDVWYSTDGVEWTKLKKDIPWEPRRAFTSLIFKNNLWIIGGVQGSINERISTYGDIWRLNL